MKRRNFLKYAALGSICWAEILYQGLARASLSSLPSDPCYEWGVLYWMPYDNDLVVFGESILEMLIKATKSSKVAIALQSDYWGEPKMRRRTILAGKIAEIAVQGEDSSDVRNFADYLAWAYRTFTVKRWAVIIVGHGGRINELSPDDHGKTDTARTWMHVDQLAKELHSFHRATGDGVELLFLQNCNKATLEVIYEVRNCAKYTLASQITLGAPNYYYEGFFARLCNSSVDGYGAAIAIMESERLDMYNSLTLINNQSLKDLPTKLTQVITAILAELLPKIDQSEFITYRYFGEQHCDVMSLLNYLVKISHRGQAELTEFAEFLQTSAIASYKTEGELVVVNSSPSPSFNRRHLAAQKAYLQKLCGLSFYFPATPAEISRYQPLALSQAVDLTNLYQNIFTAMD